MSANTQDVHFYSGGGLRLAGTMYLPNPEKDLRAGAVFCHGFGGIKEGVPVGLSTLLAQSGWTVLSFDYRGFGGSEGTRAVVNPAEQAEDIVHALEYLAQYPGIDPERIGLYATSFGSGVAAIAAHRSPRPKALILSVGVLSGSHWLRSIMRWSEFMDAKAAAMAAIARKTATGEIELVDRADIMIPDAATRARYTDKIPMALESVYHVLNHEPIAIAGELRMPVMMFGVQDDSLVPYEQTERFFEKVVAPKHLEVIPTGNHWAVYDTALPRVHEKTLEWFRRYVLPHGRPSEAQ